MTFKNSLAAEISRRYFLQSAGLLSGGVLLGGCTNGITQAFSGKASTLPRRPNMLFIWTDEQRRDTLECYGNRWLRAPNLNRLAQSSFVFDRAYVSQPVCTPSRATVLTGLYPHTHGCTTNNIPLRPETKTIAEMVSPEYVCGYVGKWHLGSEISAQHGFKHWRSIEDAYRKYYANPADYDRFSDYHHFLLRKGVKPDTVRGDGTRIYSRCFAANQKEELTKAAFCADEAADFIQANKDEPFLLHVNMLEPHMPFTGPLNNLYDPATLPVGPTFLKPPPENASLRNRLKAAWFQQSASAEESSLKDEKDWRQVRANYHGLVTMVDNAVGRILQKLEDCGLADNTIVVFTSDHGDQMGDHHLLAKCVMYEEALTVPCLIRVPWMSKSMSRIPGAFGQVDLTPTLLELMGQPLPDNLEGVSRVREMRDGCSLEDNPVFAEWNGNDNTELPAGTSQELVSRVKNQPWRTIIHKGWKLNLSPADQCELYNLNRDPFEQVNLFDDPNEKGRVGEMTARLKEWQKKTKDNTQLA